MQYDILKALEIIFVASAVAVFLLHKLNMPSLVGFLVAGIIIGPYGIGLIQDTHEVETMAEIGVVLLLFTIGIEFSMTRLMRMKKAVIGGGGAQVVLTIAVSAAAAYLAAGSIHRSIFFGFLIALSSTAIVLKMLAEKGEMDSPHGRVMVGILIFQDLCVVPLVLLTPALSGEGLNLLDIAVKMGKAAFIISAVLLGARWIVPAMLHQVVGTRSRELFIITIILICLGIALLTSKFGLSLALGAFLAGLVISESEYAHQATADILPFKESFIGLFFVSVGMLMNFSYMTTNCLKIAISVGAIFGIKTLTGILAAVAVGNPLRSSIHAGLGLAQIGEFSFVLAVAGKSSGIITEEFYQIFLSSSVVTMTMTPFVMKAAPSVAGWIVSRDLLKRAGRLKKVSEGQGHPRKRQDHVIIIGFGLNGRNLARVLKEAEVPYVVLEVNNDTVREMKKKGEPIYYGDATSAEVLHKLSLDKAKLLVVAISDPASARKIVSVAKHENPAIYLIVRTRYVAEVEDLRALGANEVIPEEFETSIEIFTRVLNQYRFPRSVAADMVERIRSGSYTALRSIDVPKSHLFDKCEWLPEIELDGFRIPDGSHMTGQSIGVLQVRNKTGVTIIACRRGAEIHANPEPGFVFLEGDIILFTGDRKSMDAALSFFKGSPGH
jgi:CPA2 family monovalent cation:H+ antiporter-2